jgi:biopolymer transport protein ExbD
MARHKSHESPADTEPSLEIASLIDICFLLLIYFIVTSTIMPRESDLAMALPTPGDSASVTESIVIRIDASGEILTGTGTGSQVMDADPEVRDLPQLTQYLEMISAASRAAGSIQTVRIDADDQATQQRVIDVLNALASTGIKHVTFSDPLP